MTLLVGETGSGKSTKLPELLFRTGEYSAGAAIGLTLPRQVSVFNISQRIAANMESHVGELVGLQVRF